jgi:RNA polymerase sigma factor (sigma-70 family)
VSPVTRRPLPGSSWDTLLETTSFHDQFTAVFDATFARLFRYLDRLSGDPELAADLSQEAFVRLYRRGAMPDSPEAWLVSVAMNLFRNTRVTGRRRLRLLAGSRGGPPLADPPAMPDQALATDEMRRHVRETVDRLPERDRRMLLLQAEGFSYREIAGGLGLHEASVGTLLARARERFRELYGDADAY